MSVSNNDFIVEYLVNFACDSDKISNYIMLFKLIKAFDKTMLVGIIWYRVFGSVNRFQIPLKDLLKIGYFFERVIREIEGILRSIEFRFCWLEFKLKLAWFIAMISLKSLIMYSLQFYLAGIWHFVMQVL